MTREFYSRVLEAFQNACDLSPAVRADYLSLICNHDQDLCHVVEGMLAADERCGRFLEELPADLAAGALATVCPRPLIGETLGDYQILSHLGTGGMGDVYLALDTRLGRKAALKLLPEEYTSDPVRLRLFEQEACAISA